MQNRDERSRAQGYRDKVDGLYSETLRNG